MDIIDLVVRYPESLMWVIGIIAVGVCFALLCILLATFEREIEMKERQFARRIFGFANHYGMAYSLYRLIKPFLRKGPGYIDVYRKETR